MFVQNKYYFVYYNIINLAKSRTLSSNTKIEKHHILPKSLGGSNESNNIVCLTPREHFICHRLLPKFTIGKERTKMLYAIWKMCHSSSVRKESFKLNARTYSTIKEAMRNSRSSEDFSPEWREKISSSKKGKPSWNKGIKRTTEEIEKMKSGREKRKKLDPDSYKQPPCSAERASRIRESLLGKKWVHNENGERRYVSAHDYSSLKTEGWKDGLGPRKIKQIECIHCKKTIDSTNYNRWHGPKCKNYSPEIFQRK